MGPGDGTEQGSTEFLMESEHGGLSASMAGWQAALMQRVVQAARGGWRHHRSAERS